MSNVYVVLGDSGTDEHFNEFILGIFTVLEEAETATFGVAYDSKWIETWSVGAGSKHLTRTIYLDSVRRQVPHEFAWKPYGVQALPPVGTVVGRNISTREVDLSELAYHFDSDSAYLTVRAGYTAEEAAARMTDAWNA